MQKALSIRIAGTEDLATIESLAQLVWPGTYGEILSADQLRYMMNLFYSPAALTKQMREQKHTFLVVEDQGQPIGFASFSQAVVPGIFKLHKLYVLPNQQGKGLGKLIIDFIIQQIRPQSAKSLQLNVNRHNKARFFYEKLGFTIIREEDIDIGEGYFMNDYVMNYNYECMN